jgi:hypothetical protein
MRDHSELDLRREPPRPPGIQLPLFAGRRERRMKAASEA